MYRPKILGIGAATVVAALALAACSSSSGTTTSTGTAPAFNAALTQVINPSDHKTTGTLVFEDFGAPDSTDPGDTYYAAMWNFIRLYETPLMTYASVPGTGGLNLVPGIATGPGQVSSDGLTWTYTIKSGLKFSNGQPITAADVKYAVERTYAKDVLPGGPAYFQNLLAPQKPAYAGPYKDKTPGHMGLKAITVSGNTISFKLAQPFADFNYVVAIPQTAPVPASVDLAAATGGAKYALNPISTGPYMFSSYTPNKQLTLVDNPNWVPQMDPAAKQLVGKIILKMNVNAATVDSDLISGNAQMDFAGGGVQTAARAQILGSTALKAKADDPVNGFIDFMYIDTKVAPLNNVHCREAVEYAANKTDTQTAYGGPFAGGAIATTSMPPNVIGYQPSDTYSFNASPGGNVTLAKQQLAACGHPNGFAVNLGYRSDSPKQTAAAQAINAALAKVGITTTLKGFPTSTYYTTYAGNTAYVHSHDLGLNMGGWGADFPTAYGWFEFIAAGNAILAAGNSNISELNDPVVNSDLLKIEGPGLSQAQRNAMAHAIDLQVMKDAAFMPEVYAKSLLYRSPQLTNVFVQDYYGMYDYAVLGLKG